MNTGGYMNNTEVAMTAIVNQLPDLDPVELQMVADYIKGLKAARIFLSRA